MAVPSLLRHCCSHPAPDAGCTAVPPSLSSRPDALCAELQLAEAAGAKGGDAAAAAAAAAAASPLAAPWRSRDARLMGRFTFFCIDSAGVPVGGWEERHRVHDCIRGYLSELAATHNFTSPGGGVELDIGPTAVPEVRAVSLATR